MSHVPRPQPRHPSDSSRSPSSVEDFLRELTAVAADVVPRAHCSVTLEHGAQAITVAATDAVAAALDQVQGLHDDGPALAAMRAGTRLDVGVLDGQDRWLEVGSYAAALGVSGGVFLPFAVDGDPVGVLSVYLRERGELTGTQVRHAQLIAEEAAAGLSATRRRFGAIPDDQLRCALTTRRLIDQALGVLMHAGQISSRAAVGTLLDLARMSRRSPGEVAAEVVRNAADGQA
jgi:hypothetical protein